MNDNVAPPSGRIPLTPAADPAAKPPSPPGWRSLPGHLQEQIIDTLPVIDLLEFSRTTVAARQQVDASRRVAAAVAAGILPAKKPLRTFCRVARHYQQLSATPKQTLRRELAAAHVDEVAMAKRLATWRSYAGVRSWVKKHVLPRDRQLLRKCLGAHAAQRQPEAHLQKQVRHATLVSAAGCLLGLGASCGMSGVAQGLGMAAVLFFGLTYVALVGAHFGFRKLQEVTEASRAAERAAAEERLVSSQQFMILPTERVGPEALLEQFVERIQV